MTNTSDKFSGGGGDVAPSPRSPASSGNGKKTQETASVPIENCLTEGVQPRFLCTTCVQECGFEGPELDLSNAESTTDSWATGPAIGRRTAYNYLILRCFTVLGNRAQISPLGTSQLLHLSG
jgi:hypothetical protein